MNVLLTQIPANVVVVTYDGAAYDVVDGQCEMPEEAASSQLADNPLLQDCVVVDLPV